MAGNALPTGPTATIAQPVPTVGPRHACPVEHCKHGGFDLATIIVQIVAALLSDSRANRTIDEQVKRVCEGSIPVKDHPDVKCTQPFTVRFRGTLKRP